jgi:DMSO/TMAO reductase YedYZ molybdopterin-dependent catalytic subunit
LLQNDFSDWKLTVEGSVARGGKYSLSDLQSFPARNQITRHTCEEGWTAIGEWTGVPLGLVLNNAGILPSARFVNFYSYDGWIDSIDMFDAFHPQTILAYGMNGKKLPVPHGAPLRLRVETRIGYKSMKYLERIVVTDEFMDLGDSGWAWYTGI